MARRPGRSGTSAPTSRVANETPPGQTQRAPGSDKPDNERLAKVIDNAMQRINAPYGVGLHGAYQDVSHPVSCSGLINSARKYGAGLSSVGGTYDYARQIHGLLPHQGSTGYSPPSGGYPAGTIFVATSGQGGPDGTHMSMSIGGGKVIEAINTSAGVHTAPAPGSFSDKGAIEVGILTDMGTSDMSALGETAGEAAGAAGGILENLTEGIANGVLRAILTVFGFMYGYLVLRLLDMWGGFWWELTSKLLGEFAEWLEDVDLIKIATGQTEDVPDLPPITSGGLTFNEENINRLFFILFVVFGYQLAFGRDSQGNYRMDNALGGLGALSNVDLKSQKAKNTRATLEADVVAELVAEGVPEPTARATARKEIKSMNDAELRQAARRIIQQKRARASQDPETKKFKVLEGGKTASIDAEAINELVKMGVPREKAERAVKRGNVREA